MKKVLVIIGAWLFMTVPVWAANKLFIRSSDNALQHSFDLANEQEIAGLAVAMKFANKEEDVNIASTSFEGTRLEKLELKEAIVDNVEKTVLIYGIVLEENYLAPGEGAIVKLTFAGKDLDKVNFTPTTIAQQEGITLVSSSAEEISYEFSDQSKTAGSPNLPKSFSLYQNYPNPFNASTSISYALPVEAEVAIHIYNILGQKVRTLDEGKQTAGYKTTIWDGKNDGGETVGSGVYLYRIHAGEFSETKKMTLLK